MKQLLFIPFVFLISCAPDKPELGFIGSSIHSSESLNLSESKAVIDVTYRTIDGYRPDFRNRCEAILNLHTQDVFEDLNLEKDDLDFLRATEISSKKDCVQSNGIICLDEISEFVIRCEYE